jgi:hypothetical protein
MSWPGAENVTTSRSASQKPASVYQVDDKHEKSSSCDPSEQLLEKKQHKSECFGDGRDGRTSVCVRRLWEGQIDAVNRSAQRAVVVATNQQLRGRGVP